MPIIRSIRKPEIYLNRINKLISENKLTNKAESKKNGVMMIAEFYIEADHLCKLLGISKDTLKNWSKRYPALSPIKNIEYYIITKVKTGLMEPPEILNNLQNFPSKTHYYSITSLYFFFHSELDLKNKIKENYKKQIIK